MNADEDGACYVNILADLVHFERAMVERIHELVDAACAEIDGESVRLAGWIPRERWDEEVEAEPVDATDDEPVDAIDAAVRERMHGGEPCTGFDFGDPTFPRCPHPWCGEDWHGLAITRRMFEMRARGEVDPDYRYAADDSDVLCPGSLFEGEFELPPQALPPLMRPSALHDLLAYGQGRLTPREVARPRPQVSPVLSLADAVLTQPDPGMPWWACDRYVELWFEVSERFGGAAAYWLGRPDDGEMIVRAILNTGGPLEIRSHHSGPDPRPQYVAVRWPHPPPVGHWRPWEPGPLILGDTFTALTRISRITTFTAELPADGLREARWHVRETFVRDVRDELHVDIDVADVVLNDGERDQERLSWRCTALWRPGTDDIELHDSDLSHGFPDGATMTADVVMLGSEPVRGSVYGRAGWNMDTRRWVYMPIDPERRHSPSRPSFEGADSGR